MTFDETKHPRDGSGQFAAKPAAEASDVSLAPTQDPTVAAGMRTLMDRTRADYPDARALVVEESEMGAFVASVQDGDGNELASAADLDEEYHDLADELSAYAAFVDHDTGDVDEDGTSRTVVALP